MNDQPSTKNHSPNQEGPIESKKGSDDLMSKFVENQNLSIIVANEAQEIMAEQIIAQYGMDAIEFIHPGNELFIVVHFKDGRVEQYYCGMYIPELLTDKSDNCERTLRAYYRMMILKDDDKRAQENEEDIPIDKDEVTGGHISEPRRGR